MILEFPHFGFGVPRFPWAREMVEVEGGGQGGGAGGAGRLSCLLKHKFPTCSEIVITLWF